VQNLRLRVTCLHPPSADNPAQRLIDQAVEKELIGQAVEM
jgi:hypothetical protein